MKNVTPLILFWIKRQKIYKPKFRDLFISWVKMYNPVSIHKKFFLYFRSLILWDLNILRRMLYQSLIFIFHFSNHRILKSENILSSRFKNSWRKSIKATYLVLDSIVWGNISKDKNYRLSGSLPLSL